jgi:hypothetical protein
MALRLRRGTDAERLLITPADGEMIWTTDTQELYVGDGTTVGGIRITGALNDSPEALTRNLDLDSNTIFGSGDINISGQITTSGSITATGTVTAGSLVGDGSQIYNLSAANLDVSDLVVEGGAYYLNVIGPDSSIVLDASTGDLDVGDITADTLTLTGDVSIGGQVIANQYYGDLIGEVHAEDSTIVIDRFGDIFSDQITSDGFKFVRTDTQGNIIQVEGDENEGGVGFVRKHEAPLGNFDFIGRLKWDAFDTTDSSTVNYAFISGSKYGLFISADPNGAHPNDKITYFHDGAVGIGGVLTANYKPTVTGDIDVNEGKINLGNVETSEVTTPEDGDLIYAPGANNIYYRADGVWRFPLSAADGSVYVPNTLPIQQPNYSTTQIGLGLSGAEVDGVLLFNTTTRQLQVYNEDSWRNVASDGGVFKGDHIGSVGIDDSSTVIDGTDGKITAPNTVTFASFTTTERDAIDGLAGGMVIFNSTTAKLQVYNGSTWLDLH